MLTSQLSSCSRVFFQPLGSPGTCGPDSPLGSQPWHPACSPPQVSGPCPDSLSCETQMWDAPTPDSSCPLSTGRRTSWLPDAHPSFLKKLRLDPREQESPGVLSEICAGCQPSGPRALRLLPNAHIHDCVNLCNSLIISGELVDLDPIADQLAHDLDLELVELTLGDGVSLGNDGNNVHLPGSGERGQQVSGSLTVDSPAEATSLGRGQEGSCSHGESQPEPSHLGLMHCNHQRKHVLQSWYPQTTIQPPN